MNETHDYTIPLIDSVLHPTDFSEGSRIAFHHALKVALLAKSKLTLLHVSPEKSDEWANFPGVRETLELWGLIPQNSPRTAVPQLGIDVRKAIVHQSDPVKSVLHHLDVNFADLIVLATHQHEGRMRWLQHSVAEPVARKAEQMTLFIPGDNAGFVSADDGSVTLENIVIPIASTPHAQPAINAAARFTSGLGCPRGTFTLLHVGDADNMPAVHCPNVPGWEWKRVTQTGDVIQGIMDTSSNVNADLVVMTTDGRDGFLDALRGSHSERLLRHAQTPLLTVPVGSQAEAYFS